MDPVCMRGMVTIKKCCFYWEESGFSNLLAGFAEVSEDVPQQGTTDKARTAFQKWHFAPGTLGSQTVDEKELKFSQSFSSLENSVDVHGIPQCVNEMPVRWEKQRVNFVF